MAELRNAGLDLCTAAPESERKVFCGNRTDSSRAHLKDTYFLDSSNKISFFYEQDALDTNGDLLVDRYAALNKVSTYMRKATTCSTIHTMYLCICGGGLREIPRHNLSENALSIEHTYCRRWRRGAFKSNRYLKSNYHRLDMRCTYYIQHSKNTRSTNA